MKLFNQFFYTFFISLVISFNVSAQNINYNDSLGIVYGALITNGNTIFITENGIIFDSTFNNKNYSTENKNKFFSEYYKKIYGEEAENPNYIMENEKIQFIPFINLNKILQNQNEIIEGISIGDIAKSFTENNYENKNNVLRKIKDLFNKDKWQHK